MIVEAGKKMDITSETRLSQVDPVLEKKVHIAVAQIALEHGIEVHVAQALRSVADQDALYAKGRTVLKDASGKAVHIVTYARGGYSSHNFGLAVDLVPGVLGKVVWTPNWDAEDPAYGYMASACKAAGLKWGGDWIGRKKDLPHFYIGPDTPTDLMRLALNVHGLQYVWDQVAAGNY